MNRLQPIKLQRKHNMKYYVAALFASLLIGSPLKAEELPKKEPQLTEEEFIKLANTPWNGNLSRFKDSCLQHQGKLSYNKDEPSPAKRWKCEFLLK